MRILLSGGSGFLGTVLCEMLASSGAELWYLTRRPRHLVNEIAWDFSSSLPELPLFDLILHLAFAVDFSGGDLLKENVEPALHLAKLASYRSVPVFFVSSVAVHGKAPIIDAHTPLSLDNPYAKTKYLVEEVFRLYAPAVTIFRLGGIYGLNGPRHLGLNNAISEARQLGKPPSLLGSGAGLRNYICVHDVAAWIARSIESPDRNAVRGPQYIYIAGQEIISLRELLEKIAEILTPGKVVDNKAGNSDAHQIIIPSQPPFALTRFEDYLVSIR